VREGLWERYEQLFKNFGWDVVILKYGSLQHTAFKEPGGEKLRQWIDNCPNPLYSALVFAGGAAWRNRLNDEIGNQGDVSLLIDKRSDDQLATLMNNLGGHDLPSLLEAFHNADNDRPTCFETGGSIYLRLSTRPIEQISRAMTQEPRQQIVDGAYWLRKPGPNSQVIVAYTGAIAPEAIAAVGLMAEDRRDVGLLAVTSADRLNAGWTAASTRARAWPRACAIACRTTVRRRAGALWHRHRAGWTSGDACLAGGSRGQPRTPARRRAFRSDRISRRPLPPLRH
jgi:pyruvate dehydrogenase complex dehydrogenase (E1) component